jgi:hypothetical protein
MQMVDPEELELDPVDRAALKLALVQCRALDPGRIPQLDKKLEDGCWVRAAEFAAFSQQIDRMGLKPWQLPPCCVRDENKPRPGEETAARVLHRMLDAGISQWHPDPLAALAAARNLRRPKVRRR